ncbi:MAG TPA: formimidoylglutamate deiminase [Thermohalobaculum sp.]|nr:formimidoylglutamate deiminase [Thermohalobaculum sp.]
MADIHASRALLPEGWARDVTVTLGEDGRIAGVRSGDRAPAGADILLPAPANLHSHAFQRAMAGRTEARSGARDSFWTWRALMYRFLDRLTPEQVEAIAAQVQVEMLEAGYAAVGEFHYLHHQPDGTPYDDLAEMSGRIAAAARTTGIGLTLLPVLYVQGGIDGRALEGGQRRFGNDLDRFARLCEGARAALCRLPGDAVPGIAPHSLRAVPPPVLADAVAAHGEGPIHIHVAEQTAEVDEIEAAWGARPVEWLLTTQPVDALWCLIHATHMTPPEVEEMAATGATAGLCPVTEANLGDGIFDGARFLEAGGRFGVGSDSNVAIGLAAELRQLEYSQRLRDRSRAVLADADRSTGRVLYEGACGGGARALGRDAGAIREGAWADLVALDGDALALAGLDGDALLDGWIFAGDDRVVADVWSAGRHVVGAGRHHARDAVERRFRDAMRQLAE